MRIHPSESDETSTSSTRRQRGPDRTVDGRTRLPVPAKSAAFNYSRRVCPEGCGPTHFRAFFSTDLQPDWSDSCYHPGLIGSDRAAEAKSRAQSKSLTVLVLCRFGEYSSAEVPQECRKVFLDERGEFRCLFLSCAPRAQASKLCHPIPSRNLPGRLEDVGGVCARAALTSCFEAEQAGQCLTLSWDFGTIFVSTNGTTVPRTLRRDG